MNNVVRLYDTVTIVPTDVDGFRKTIKDGMFQSSGQTQGLSVEIVATHAGRLTRNYGFYLPHMMKNGATSMTDQYMKPILVNHDSHSTPIGRIVSAQYVDISNTFARDSAAHGILQDICQHNVPFIRMLDLVDKLADTELLQDPSYPGLGYILAKGTITDQDAIKRILDKRYMTVSTGAATDKAICRICKQDWVEEGPCEHRPGKVYDKKLAFIIAGKLLYDELSFVNVPADPLARVITVSNGIAQDTVTVETSDNTTNVNAIFSLCDAKMGGINMDPVKEAWDKVVALLSDEATKDEDAVKAIEDFLSEFKDKFTEDTTYRQDAEQKLAELKDKLAAANVADDESAQDLDNEVTDEEKHYEDMIEFGWKLSLLDDGFEDAKLSTEQRKKMAKSTFCKPEDRKYPVPDCSHARVAMAYAKKLNESSSVVACIRRKAKALGCPFGESKKDGIDSFEAEIDTILADYEASLQQQDSAAANVQDSVKPVVPVEPTPATPVEPAVKPVDEVHAILRQELKDIWNEFAEAEEAHATQLECAKELIADMLVKLELLTGKKIEDTEQASKELAACSLEDMVKHSNTLKDSLDLDAILGKLNDGMSNIPSESVQDPTLDGTNPTDPAVVEDPFKEYKDKYKKILVRDGFNKARDFVERLVQGGLVPANFDPER